MIKCTSIKESKNNEFMVSLIADTPNEVTAIGSSCKNVVGLPENAKMTLGSTCLCANGDFGILNSQGIWTF